MRILDPNTITFEQCETGYLSLRLDDDTTYEAVECIPLFPFSLPKQFITVACKKDNVLEEIGIIEKLEALPQKQQALVNNDIRLRFFTPEITDVAKVVSKHGTAEWNVTTDSGEKSFFVGDPRENILFRDNGLILVTDINRCRYQIADYRRMPPKAQAILEKLLL